MFYRNGALILHKEARLHAVLMWAAVFLPIHMEACRIGTCCDYTKVRWAH